MVSQGTAGDQVMLPTKEAEGLRLKAYKDTVGVPTVGYGHNLNNTYSKQLFENLGIDYAAVRSGKQSLTKEQADAIFEHDHALAEQGAREVVAKFGGDYDSQPEWIRNILSDLVFNMGAAGVAKFKQSIPAMIKGEYDKAAASLQQSKWYGQVGRRSKAIIADLKAGRDTYAML